MQTTKGFTLDAFTNVTTVTSLGMQPLLASNYARFASDNFSAFVTYNAVGLLHRTFTATMAQGLRVAALWIGALQVVAGWSTLGDLIAILKYVRLEQSGLKMVSRSDRIGSDQIRPPLPVHLQLMSNTTTAVEQNTC